MSNKHNPKNYTVEIHHQIDVFHRDFGPEIGCAERAIERLKADKDFAGIIRLWHAGKCLYEVDLRA